jgi:hypothetical protein
MRALLALGLALAAVPLLAPPAGAMCRTISPDVSPDVDYTTACALDRDSVSDGTQTWTNDYVVHVTHDVRAFSYYNDYVAAQVAKGTYTYDDGTTQQHRSWTDVGAGTFQDAADVAGGGVQADVIQRDQDSIEPEGSDACSSYVGHSTCAGASAWLSVNGVASLGAGAYFQQEGTGAGCQQAGDVELDLLGLDFEQVPLPQGPCAVEAPDLGGLPVFGLPPL